MILLKNATVINGTGELPIYDTTVAIQGNRIESVSTGKYDLSNVDIIIDLKGKFVLPGLIDAHVHFGGADVFDYPGIGNRIETYDYLKSRSEALKWGVTTIRSAGDYTPEILEFRDEVNSGRHISPRVFAAGKMFQARGGHPLDTVFGTNEKIAAGACVLVDEATDIDDEVKKLVDAGVDWIKIFISEINKLNYPAAVNRIPPEKIKRITDTAHKYGKPCMIHVDDACHFREAAEAGADSIEHTLSGVAKDTGIADDVIELLIKNHTFVIPTITAIKAHETPGFNMPPIYEKLVSQVSRLIKAGVSIGVGTDSGIPFVPIGPTLHDELAELVKCGMSPMDAITAATSGNAKLLRMEKNIGAILPGYLADLLVVEGNPTKDISLTKNISYVIMDGRLVTDRRLIQ